MDLYVDRDAFVEELSRIQGIIERRASHPLLSYALLHAVDGKLKLTATDTEAAYIGVLEANIEQEGQLALDAVNLFHVVRALTDSTVQLSVGSNHQLHVKSGSAHYKLPGSVADDFPPLPAFDQRGAAKLKGADVRRLVEQTSFAVCTDDVRHGLNGAHLEKDTDGDAALLRMVGADGHRLAAASVSVDGEFDIPPRMLVPRKALANIKRLLDGSADDEVELAFGDGAIRLNRKNQSFWFRMLDGEFPDYTAVVPSEHKHQAVVDRSALLGVLKRVSIVVQDRARAVRFDFQNEALSIDAENADRGQFKEAFPIELEGEPLQVGFNSRYLADVLGSMTGERVAMELAHPLAPCMVRDPDADDAFFVIMPMRLD